jgi:acyl carrier protein
MSTLISASDTGAVTERVVGVLERRFGVAAREIDPRADLPGALPGYDSLAALEVVTAIEETFGIEVDFVADDVRYSFSTVERISDYVSDALEDQAGRA